MKYLTTGAIIGAMASYVGMAVSRYYTQGELLEWLGLTFLLN